MNKCVPELYRKCSVVFSMITWHCTHVHLYPHVLNVLIQYLTCTSPEYWVCLPNSLEHGVTLSWCNMSDAISYMRLAKCKQNKYLCCESQPHTHTQSTRRPQPFHIVHSTSTIRLTRKCRTLQGWAWASSYYCYIHMNRLSFTLKWWAKSLVFMSVAYANDPYLSEAIF